MTATSKKSGLTVTDEPIYRSDAGAVLLAKINFDLNSNADQVVTLVGGGEFIIEDVIIKNAKDGGGLDLGTVNAKNFQIQDAASRAGNIMCASVYNGFTHIDSSLLLLIAKNVFTNSLTGIGTTALNLNGSNIVCGNTLYASLATVQGAPATADVLIYGYITG